MTIKQAFRALLAPYILPEITIEFLLFEQGLDSNDECDTEEEKESVYKAVIEGLYKVKTLKKEEDPGSANTYDTDKIDELIRHYRRKLGLEDEDEVYFIDRTDEY